MNYPFGAFEGLQDTILLRSLKMGLSDSYIAHTMSNANVNQENSQQVTPLHLAVTRRSTDIAHQLIKRGANINARDYRNETPLHYAVRKGKLDAIHLLLYYGAETHLPHIMNLLEPVAGSSFGAILDILTTFETAYKDRPWYSAIRQAPVNIGAFSFANAALVHYAFLHRDFDLFKLVWSKCLWQTFVGNAVPFLLIYVHSLHFSTPDWLHGLKSMLSSSAKQELIRDFAQGQFSRQYVERSGKVYYLLTELFTALRERKVGLNDKALVLSLVIDGNINMYLQAINQSTLLYEFGDETEALVYAGDFSSKACKMGAIFPSTYFLLAVEEPDMEFVCKQFKYQYTYTFHIESDVKTFHYFSMPPAVRQELIDFCTTTCLGSNGRTVCETLATIPRVPSLLEMSRNATRRFVRATHRILKPYQFYEAVKSLCLPPRIEDIILFKIPLY